ncbi:MAG: S49 family peptidase [Shimia sp.]
MKRLIPFMPPEPTIAVVRLDGMIASGRGLNDAGIGPVLEKAFRSKPKAVALVINSPGGSAVQSSLIGARIRRLSEEKNVPVTAFVEDVAASGGYWLAAAADDIIVDPSSVIGSIGVISAGFGLHELIDRYGIERRVHTAGESKSMLDPFRPEQEEDVKRLHRLLEGIHDNFKDHVRSRRGDKLVEGDLFTGEIWVGQGGVDVGLADALGHLQPVMKERHGDKVKFKYFGRRKPLLSRLGGQALAEAGHQIEERAAYARFGL